MANRGGAFFLMLFGAIFLAVGGVMGFLSLRTLDRAQAMKRWKETPARVVSCDLQRNRGSKGGYTYCAKATYRYAVNGVAYTADRVSLHTGSDNIGDFHQQTHNRLKRCLDKNEETVCWVDPDNPAEAVLIRKPRLEMLIFMQLFVLAFGGAGLGIVLAGLARLLQPSAPAAETAGQGQIRMRGASSYRVAGALALAWNGYTGWFLWRAFSVMAPEPLPWWLWLMALTGAIPAVVAGYLIGRFRKFGMSVFEMSPMPGVLGGPVNGMIRIPAKVETEAGFDLTLQCIHQYTTRSGKNSTTHHDVLWEDAHHIDGGGYSYGEETMLPVRFSAPYGSPATTVAGGSNGYYWQLKAAAAAPGIDYLAVFDVPVRHTPQSAEPRAEAEAPEAARRAEPVGEVVARERLRLAPRSDGGFELTFPAGRQWGTALSLTLFMSVWTAACVAMWASASAPVLMAVVFSAFDVLLLLFVFSLVFVSRGVVVDRARRECVVWWRLAGLPRRERRVPFEEILDAASERAGQSGNQLYYRIVLSLQGGSPVTVGSGLRMWTNAERLAELIRASIKPAFG